MAWPGWRTGPGLGVSLVWPKPSGAKWRSGWKDGPDLKTDGVVRWRCADLRDRIAAKFNGVCVTFRAGRNRFGTLTLRKHSRIQREGSLRKI